MALIFVKKFGGTENNSYNISVKCDFYFPQSFQTASQIVLVQLVEECSVSTCRMYHLSENRNGSSYE